MSDEMECFRRAAELGCNLLRINEGNLEYKIPSRSKGIEWVEIDALNARGKKCLAAEIANWWSTKGSNCAHSISINDYVDKCRAFERKHGEE